mmetsp:Transcript_28087/g.39228  ORF Transcript_28087/g.39228 Transcript_28087/m.39228 type:complete len:216 (-) Transcript_28087:158-805(-)|eukprot:CAMPEP_0185264774 /NCGR_PEP_ID=MMETSP1359-20130426/24722_1 /TAXON_ID=552665 /ORGANISM="Bigelowiella longifila, Strain CCMP242" /LENGTH=215 /DNA_ID=CAMNT_0027853571 /DNA_START=36 /DNA_END=683 /DNA_ORIENTATION=+
MGCDLSIICTAGQFCVVYFKADVFQIEKFNGWKAAEARFEERSLDKVSRVMVDPDDIVLRYWFSADNEKDEIVDYYKSETGRTLKIKRKKKEHSRSGSRSSRSSHAKNPENSSVSHNSCGSRRQNASPSRNRESEMHNMESAARESDAIHPFAVTAKPKDIKKEIENLDKQQLEFESKLVSLREEKLNIESQLGSLKKRPSSPAKKQLPDAVPED